MTSIEWVKSNDGTKGKTWNPIVGCSKTSEGCQNCYAINQAYRNNAMAQALPEDKRGRLSYYKGLTEKRGDRVEWTGKVSFVPEALDIPLKTRKPTVYFVNSMSDLFHESVTDEQLDQIFVVMALTPQHTYQCLTKRPERMLEYFEKRKWDGATYGGIALSNVMRLSAEWRIPAETAMRCHFPLPNVWLGVTVENQKAADDRIPLLLKTPAAIRFLSCEPLLEKVDLLRVGWLGTDHKVDVLRGGYWEEKDCFYKGFVSHSDIPGFNDGLISWVIVGGESGHNARPCSIEWIRSVVRQCQNASVPVFTKQLGSKPFVQIMPESIGNIPWEKSTGKGGNIDEFPEDLKVREMPIY